MKHTNYLLVLLLLQLFPVNVRCQGFGKDEVINKDWFFHLGDITYAGAEFFDHADWQKLDLPHDWSVEQIASPGYASCTGYLPGGIGWYRKELTVPEEQKGKKLYVYFEGVYNNSEVFINGKWIGKRPNGYVSFMYDLTPYINWGGRNVLAVKVDHSQSADSRWYTGSGIYRDVHLVYADPVHINLWGVSYVAEVKGRKAALTFATEINNTTDKVAALHIKQEIFDKEHRKVGETGKSIKLPANHMEKVEQSFQLNAPVLWSLDNPYLYTIRTQVTRNGKLIDQSETSAGIRTLGFDPDKGFSLNGQSMKIKGVCIHHDAGCLGAAVPKEVWRRRLLILKEMGCNALRMSHNPQASYIYDLCDELGLLVKDEAFDEWEYPKKKWITGWNRGIPGFQGSAGYFREWAERDLADMIRRDRNHPSIIMWSIGNEVDYPNDPYSHPVLDREGIGQQHVKGYQTGQPRAERLGEIARNLVREAKKHDLSRPVTAALAGPVMSNETDYPKVLDVVGYNYTEKRYPQDHENYPDRILYGSETGHGLEAWKAVRDNDYIFGQFIWCGYDFLGEAGPWPARGSTAGLIDMAGNIKPGGYYQRALWSESPVAYVGTYKPDARNRWLAAKAPAVWNYEEGETIRVVAYTNCREAELLLNGKPVGERKPYDDQTAIISWDIPYAPGILEVVAYNDGKAVANDKIQSSGRPYALKASFFEEKQVGPDTMLQLLIQVVDENGIPVVLADNEVTIHPEGPVRLVGMENGGSNVTDNYRGNRLRCKSGKLVAFLKVTDKAGLIRIKLTSPLLQSASISVPLAR